MLLFFFAVKLFNECTLCNPAAVLLINRFDECEWDAAEI
jgi:hypothetical protein